jgi:hypothetical protein
MTTHEQTTRTESPDEPSTPAPETAQVNDERTAVNAEQEPASDTAAPSVDTAEATSEAPEPAPKSANHEVSADETLFADDDLADLRARWAGVQATFVDDPKDCVEKADTLVSDVVEQLTAGFAETRWHLEEQWNRGEEASTEDLRLALMHYRKFFERLLAV